MISTIVIIVLMISAFLWHKFPQNSTDRLPQSSNKTYKYPLGISPIDITNQIEDKKGNPILLFLYTTWCSICKDQIPIINEIAREFQNTDLKVISVAIDKNIDDRILINYLNYYQNIYFQPTYLVYNEGLSNLLAQKNIKYNKIIPLTVLIDKKGIVNTRFTGRKSKRYLNRKIIKILNK